MYFLVDFENVLSDGLRGAQYLKADDTVIIFYSQVCEQVQQGVIRQIMDSACHLDICKLQKQGKNALDFYIATYLGAVFGSGYAGKAAIVSRDQGFTAVRDYWKGYAGKKAEVILGPTLEQCIVSANENLDRTAQAREGLKKVKLETEFAVYKERRRIRETLEKAFMDTEYGEKMGAIQNLFEKQSGRKILYLDSVKTFGRKDGLEIYRKMRCLIG